MRGVRPDDCARKMPNSLTPSGWRRWYFQRYVEAMADVRVTIIGDKIFAASTDVRKMEYPVDFRFNPDARFEAHTLRPEIQETLLLLMRRMGLEYGAIDLRLTPDGDYVFLEINPAGQFLWIEEATGRKNLRRACSAPDARPKMIHCPPAMMHESSPCSHQRPQ